MLLTLILTCRQSYQECQPDIDQKADGSSSKGRVLRVIKTLRMFKILRILKAVQGVQ